MKINEKNLCIFATTPPVDLEGFLNKRGEINKSWQKRWFVLKGNLLFYFEKKTDKEPLGMIILEGCTVELAEEGEQYCFQIIFHGPNNRTYYLSTESQANMEQWMKALTCAGYDYMKLMVTELQRQLDEIEECNEKPKPEMTHPSSSPPPPPPPPKAPPRRHNSPYKLLTTECDSSKAFNLPSPSVTRKAPPVPPVTTHTMDDTQLVTASCPIPPRRNADPENPSSSVVPTEKICLLADIISTTLPPNDDHAAQRKGRIETIVRSEETELHSKKPLYSFDMMHQTLGAPILAELSKRKRTLKQSNNDSEDLLIKL